MKISKGFIVGMVSLLGVTALAGCKKDKEIKLTKVSVAGVSRTYAEGAAINWDALRVTATYSDDSTATFTKFEYDVTSVVSSETQAVIYTSGLHEQTSAVKGVYAISVALPSDLSTKHSAGNISVLTVDAENYALVECSDPVLKTGFAANTKGAGTAIEPERDDKEVGKANENKFIGSNPQYVVGTLNPFIYEPEVSFESKNDPTADLVSGDDTFYKKDYVVKVKSGNEYVKAASADYTVVGGHVKFNDSAIGKTFSLTVSLTDFPVVEGTTKKAESTFEGFTVQKGLNIYNAKQLGILNVTKLTTQQLSQAKYNEHHGDTDTMFWNGTDYYKPVLNEVWSSFLVSGGIFTAEELQAYADTPAIFLQRKLEVKPTDIPQGYFITANEPASAVKGCLRDSIPVYAPIVGDHDVEINGNFWTLDSTALPLCKNERSNNGPVPYIEGQEDVIIMPGHTPLFKFCGIESESDDVFYTNQVVNSQGKGIIRNINTIGNTGVDLVSQDFEKMLSLTGLIFAKNDYCGALYENCIIKQYQIGVFPNSMPGQAVGGHEQVDRTFVNEVRVYDCANSGLFNYFNGGTLVSKSVFNRFGASPVMNAGSDRENRASNTKFTSDCIFNNEITGEEIYFSALGATGAVGQIKGFNELFKAIGNQFVYQITDKNGKKVDVMNLVSIGINGDDYLKADTPEYYSNVTLNAGGSNQLQANTYQWGMYSNLRQAIHDITYAQEYAKQWATAQETHATMYKAAYDENRQSEETLAEYQTQYNQAYPVYKEAAARKYLKENNPAFAEVDEKDIPQPYVDACMADPDFTAGFEAEFIPTFNAMFEAGFKAKFDVEFAKKWKEVAGFDFDEASFKAYFDVAFEIAFDEDYQQPPVFQTEIPTELFWTNLEALIDGSNTPVTKTLEGNYLHLLVPVGNTCLSLVFRIGKLPVQA